MSGRVAYLDTSAFVKLVVVEGESASLRRYLEGWPERVSATLVRTEAVRALRRAGYGNRIGAARRLMSGMRLVRLDETTLDWAADLDPPELRSLDAIHLAAALAVGPDLGVMLTYDERLADAARLRGLVVQSPR